MSIFFDPNEPTEELPLLVGLQRAAKLLSMGQTWLREQVLAGTMPHVRLGKKIMFEPEVLRAVVKSLRKGKKTKKNNMSLMKQYVGHDVIDVLLKHVPNSEWGFFIQLCRYAGARKQEANSLRWEDIDWVAQRVWLGIKNRRVVPLNKNSVIALKSIHSMPHLDNEFVFKSLSTMPFSKIVHELKKIMEHANVSYIPHFCHKLRTSWLIDQLPVNPHG